MNSSSVSNSAVHANPVPSWVRLLDSPLFAGSDAASVQDSRKETPETDDTAAMPRPEQQGSWHNSPILNHPVTGYYNRVTQSNLSLNRPFGEASPLSAQAPPSDYNTNQWEKSSSVPPPTATNTSHWANLLSPPYYAQRASSEDDALSDKRPPSSRSRYVGEPGIYSELFSPLVEDWPRECDRPTHRDKSPSFVLQNGAGDLCRVNDKDRQFFSKGFPLPLPGNDKRGGFLQQRLNEGFTLNDVDYDEFGSMKEEEEDTSRDRPDLLKPEEYLSGEKGPDACSDSIPYGSIQGASARCPCWVTSLLIVMGMVVVGLAVALTVSVLERKDSAVGDIVYSGYPVVRASLFLKILNKNFTLGMDDPGSQHFDSVASPYSTELDRLFLLSPLRDVYRGNKVTSLGPGSVEARAELLFLDTGLVQDSKIVQNVISSAERASQWEQSDAREIGQFVVCADCATVNLDFTRVRQLPPRPVLGEVGSSSFTSLPSSGTASAVEDNSSDSSVTKTGSTSFESSASTTTPPIVDLRNSTSFLSDGHFVISCDVKYVPVDWSTLTMEFKSDNSSAQQSPTVVLATLRKGSAKFPEVTNSVHSKLSAFSDVSEDSVGLVINVTSLTCADTGDYLCRLTLRNGQEFFGDGRVEIQELPTKPVVKESWSSVAWEATPVYSCSAQLGYPPGKLTLSIGDKDSSDFRPISGHMIRRSGCEAETEVRVSSLDSASLGNGSRLLCQLYSRHLQLLDSTQYSVFHQITLTPKLEIQTKSASSEHGLAAIRCRLRNPGTWSRLTLLRLAPNTGHSEEVVSMSTDRSIVWTDFRLRHRSLVTTDVRATRVEFSVFIYSIKCADEALYACSVQPEGGSVPPRAFLNVTVNPTKPELTVPADVKENYVTPFSVTCKAKVGRPAGRLVLAAKHQNEADFRELEFNEQTIIPLSCTTEVRGIFYPGAGALRNGSSVSCRVVPHESLHPVTVKTTQVVVFETLPADLCLGLQDMNISHPTDCRHVVQCKNDVIANVTKCPDGFCVNAETGSCVELPFSERPPADDDDTLCFTTNDSIYMTTHPNLRQCSSYVECRQGRRTIRHCPAGQLYVANRRCSTDVTHSFCYRTLDTSHGLVTNTSVIS